MDWNKAPLVTNTEVQGLTMDNNDHLWMSCSGEGKIVEVDVEKKRVLREILPPKARQVYQFITPYVLTLH